MRLLSILAFLLTANFAHAATYSTTLDYMSNNSYTERAGGTVFGASLSSGDTVQVTHKTQGDDFWTLNSTSLWVFLNTTDSGDRRGDTTLSFYNNGALVDTAGILDSLSRYIHIGQRVNVLNGLNFDTLVFTYLFNSSTATKDIVKENYFVNYWTNDVTYNVAAVPLPASAFLIAPALLGFIGVRRKSRS